MATTRLSFLGIPGRPYGALRLLAIAAAVGTMTFSGPEVTLKAPRIVPTTASYTFYGPPVSFGAPAARTTRMTFLGIPGMPYNETDLTTGLGFSVAVGNYTFSGPEIDLRTSAGLVPITADYTFSGPAASLIVNQGEAADNWFNNSWWRIPTWGTSNWWGTAGSAPSYAMSVDPANYTFSAPDATLKPPFRFAVDAGNYVFSAPDAILLTSGGLQPTVGSYVFYGSPVTFLYTSIGSELTAAAGAYTFSGPPSDLIATLKLNEAALQQYSSVDEVISYQLTDVRVPLVAVVNPELIPDPEFNDPTAWRTGDGPEVSGGTLHFTNDQQREIFPSPLTYPAVPGRQYVYNIVVSAHPVSTTSSNIRWGDAEIYVRWGVGTKTGTVTASSTKGLHIYSWDCQGWVIESISIKEV